MQDAELVTEKQDLKLECRTAAHLPLEQSDSILRKPQVEASSRRVATHPALPAPQQFLRPIPVLVWAANGASGSLPQAISENLNLVSATEGTGV
jgi:hypothetical protein